MLFVAAMTRMSLVLVQLTDVVVLVQVRPTLHKIHTKLCIPCPVMAVEPQNL